MNKIADGDDFSHLLDLQFDAGCVFDAEEDIHHAKGVDFEIANDGLGGERRWIERSFMRKNIDDGLGFDHVNSPSKALDWVRIRKTNGMTQAVKTANAQNTSM